MKEIIKQFALFGNFNQIDFTNVTTYYSDLYGKYNFILNGAEDVPSPQDPFSISINTTIVRPQLTSIDKKRNIFFGASRINIEEFNDDNCLVNDFFELVLDIINKLKLESDNFSVNRLALNGKIILEDKNIYIKKFSQFFTQRAIYDKPDEWGFRINSKILSDDLGCRINRISSFNLGMMLENQIEKEILFSSYDFNTEVLNNGKFTLHGVKIFMELANNFRKLFLEELK